MAPEIKYGIYAGVGLIVLIILILLVKTAVDSNNRGFAPSNIVLPQPSQSGSSGSSASPGSASSSTTTTTSYGPFQERPTPF